MLASDGAGYSFAHDLLREAVYGDLLPGERARLHAAHAAALEGPRSAPAAEVAHHFTEAQDAPKVLVWSIRAADEAIRLLAPGEALQHLERALAQWPNLDDAAARAGDRTAGWPSARRARRGSPASRPGAPTGRPGRSSSATSTATEKEASRRGPSWSASSSRPTSPTRRSPRRRRPSAWPSDADPASVALAHVVLARALLANRRTDEARPVADRALVEARAAGLPALEVEALATLGFLDEVDGDRGAAADRLGSRPAAGAGRGRADRGAARALLAGVPPLLQRRRQRVAPGPRAAMTRVTRAAFGGASPESS